MSDDPKKEIVLKAWETYQRLIASLGEACWKIRSVFYTASFGLIAASFSSDLRALYLLIPLLSVLFCFLEAGYQQIQEQYIDKTIEIEQTINDLLAGEATPHFPDEGVRTSLRKLTLKDLFRLFRPKKYLFWLSYLAVIFISMALFFCNVTKIRFTIK
jgi:hypothetical protein